MKFRFLALLCSASLFILSSCGSAETKSATDTKEPDSSGTPEMAKETPSTIVTTPTNMLVVHHKVANYWQWKMNYDGHDSSRLANGVHSYVIGRGIEDSNDVMVAMKVDDVSKAKAFVNDPGMKTVMQKGGVKGKSEINFNVMVWQDTANIGSLMRSRTMFTVKDFDAWRKSFESHRQTRIDNGVIDRAFGHDVNDPTKVVLVVAISDTTKAKAFWTSDLLKQQRAESGVTSAPVRFLYTVAERH
jgi:hypothetical protein